MTNVDKPEPGNPAVVTGEEWAHPVLRLLARAVIELARQQLSKAEQGCTGDKAANGNEGDRRG